MKEQDELHERFSGLQKELKSLILGTVGLQGLPRVSYAPFVRDESGCFYIYLSRLSEHTPELIGSLNASVLLIEDESKTSQMFARRRVSYQCDATIIERDNSGYEEIIGQFSKRFGSIVDVLNALPDFILFRLVPRSGRFVTGFGQAYNLAGERLDQLSHVGPEQIKRK